MAKVYLGGFAVVLDVFVGEGDEVGGAARALADDDGHRRRVSDVLEDRSDRVHAALDDDAHHRNRAVRPRRKPLAGNVLFQLPPAASVIVSASALVA